MLSLPSYAIDARMIQLSINNVPREMPEGSTLADIVQHAGIDVREVAMMVNDAIIARSAYANTVLKHGDSVEMLSFIGGG